MRAMEKTSETSVPRSSQAMAKTSVFNSSRAIVYLRKGISIYERVHSLVQLPCILKDSTQRFMVRG